MRTRSREAVANSQVKTIQMNNKVLLSLIVIILACAGLLVTTSHFHAKNVSVSGQFKETTSKNDLMLWESLSSHLLSLN